MKCTVLISADSETGLLEAAVQHAVPVHHERDTPDLRNTLRTLFADMPMAKAA